jgi:pimeloyl-ACP methyl ester carboxylesterase
MAIEWIETTDGRRLAADRRGEGASVVVFEAGMAASRHSWGAVAPLVAERTTTLAYDRSGLGDSPPDDQPRRLDRLADDLLDVLDHLGEPAVLVAHSWGGPVVRTVAARAPERVAGMVLVDQTDEGCALYFRKGFEQQEQRFARLVPALARLGVTRLLVKRLTGNLPAEDRKAMSAKDGSVAQARTHRAELLTCNADLRRLHDEPLTVPDVPVTYLSGTKPTRFSATQRECLVAAHRAAAEALPQGRHVEAKESGHMVLIDEPDLVAAEVLRIVDLSQAARS